jgi:catechol 2,3-dioxygenase-like lactoylglutathione lyase family enzyme
MNHIELNVSDLRVTRDFYQPLFEALGWTLYQEWAQGFSYQNDGWYIVFVQAEKRFLEMGYHRKHIGLNHLAFKVASRQQFDDLVAQQRDRGVTELYADLFPLAGGGKQLTFYIEDPDRIKIELVFDNVAVEENPKPKTTKPAKAQHRFSQSLSDIAFSVDYNGATATVYWQKRNELVVKAGGVLAQEVPLNKDGSVGFGARFALTLREEHKDAIGPDFVTTQDIVLKSVNEVGHLLYFAGTNSWLVLKDEVGRTLDDYSIVK